MLHKSKLALAITLLGTTSASLMIGTKSATAASLYQHVLLLSVDGLRESDLTDPSLQAALTNINGLKSTGITYTNASTSTPSDSFPGVLSYLTGASPKTTGVYYDDSYSRTLTAPGGTVATPKGTEVQLAENIDKNLTYLAGGAPGSGANYGATNANGVNSSIDPTQLPQDCSSGTCKPVYPHDYLQTNTIFQVAANAGLYTAYSDKHPAYDIANGNSKYNATPGKLAIKDFYSPEINSNVALLDKTTNKTVDPKTLPNNVNLNNYSLVDASNDPLGPNDPNLKSGTTEFKRTAKYDDLKVQAIINEINGKNSLGTTNDPVPAIFGMNFQALSVAEKSPTGGIPTAGNPSTELTNALSHTDSSIGQIVNALQTNGLLNNTLVVVTAKHGQDPRIGTGTLVKDNVITNALTAAGINVTQNTSDDSSYIWLTNQSQAAQAQTVLQGLKALPLCGGTVQSNCNPGIQNVFLGNQVSGFGNPSSDSRTPDLAVQLLPGFVLAGNGAVTNGTKIAEHGGFPTTGDATHVALILSGGLSASLQGKTNNSAVSTTQVAVTTLDALGLDPSQLVGAKIEGTQALPGIASLSVGAASVPEPSTTGGLLGFLSLFGIFSLRSRLKG